METPDIEGGTDRSGTFQPGEEMTQRGSYWSVQIPDWGKEK